MLWFASKKEIQFNGGIDVGRDILWRIQLSILKKEQKADRVRRFLSI